MQARLGRALNLTVSVSGFNGQGLGTALHSADEDAPDLGDPWMGVNLERDGPGRLPRRRWCIRISSSPRGRSGTCIPTTGIT